MSRGAFLLFFLVEVFVRFVEVWVLSALPAEVEKEICQVVQGLLLFGIMFEIVEEQPFSVACHRHFSDQNWKAMSRRHPPSLLR